MNRTEKNTIIIKIAAFWLLGMVLGVMFANLLYPYRKEESDLLGFYIWERIDMKTVSSRIYFFYLLGNRLKIWCCFICIMVFTSAPQLIFWGIGMIGFLQGALAGMAVLYRGMTGIFLMFFGLFPHFFLYGNSILLFLTETGIWKGDTIFRRKKHWKLYGKLAVVSFFWWMLGVVTEWIVNPWILSWILPLVTKN